MSEIGAFLSSEEHGPKALIAQAQMAEAAHVRGVFVSDHFHPWIDAQGQSPFVWSVVGGIAEAGFDKIYVNQIGPEQEGFFEFYEKELRPRLAA
jgi:hypothetical protein